MYKTKNKYSILIGLDIGLAFLTLLSGLLFYSLILYNGYQLYCAFLLIPLLTIGQTLKIYILFNSKNSTVLFLISIFMTFLYYIPFSDNWTHNIKITYPLSMTVYFCLTIFLVAELVAFTKQRNAQKSSTADA